MCSAKGCRVPVPNGLMGEHMCVLHFTLFIEQECAEMRRETALGIASHERQVQFMERIEGRGQLLGTVGRSGYWCSDELKQGILSTILTFMITGEILDR